MVDVAGRWGESYYSYPGIFDLKGSEISRSHIHWQIPPVKGTHGKFEKHTKKAENLYQESIS